MKFKIVETIFQQMSHHSWGFPGGPEVKASASKVGDLGSIPGWGRSPGEGNGNPLQYSCLENPMEGGAWQVAVHGVAKSQTRLSYFTFTFHFLNAFYLETIPRQQPYQLLSLNSSGSFFFSLRDQSSTISAVKCLKTCFTFFLKLSCCLRKICSIMARSKNSMLYSMIFETCSLCFNQSLLPCII